MNFYKLAEYLLKYAESNAIPAIDCSVYREHEEVFRLSCGHSDREGKIPVSPQDEYWIYSVSSIAAATVFLQMTERKILEENYPVAYYLPKFAKLTYCNGRERTKCRKTLKIRHLISMQGGYGYTVSQKLSDYIASNPNADLQELAAQFAKEPLRFEPGEHFALGWCMDVLGAAMEAACGKSLEQWLREELFEPLGMENTGFHPDEEQTSRISAQYSMTVSGEIMPECCDKNLFITMPNFDSAGAGLCSTVNDYILLADALACGGVGKNGKRILSEESVKRFSKNLLEKTQLADFRRISRRPGYGYGYGVRTCISELNFEPKGTFGRDGEAGAHVLIDPVNKLSLVYFQHVLDMEFLHAEIFPVMDRFLYEGLK